MLLAQTRFRWPLLSTLCVLLTMPGCATIAGGARDKKVQIDSTPSGAAVTVDGQPCGNTPAVVQLSRRTEHQVQIDYPGYETAHVCVRRRLNPWVFGNILLGGLVGVVIDVCTDATHDLSPGSIHVYLRGQPPAGAPPGGQH